MFFDQFKKVYFEDNGVLVNPQLSYHLHEFLSLIEVFKNLPLMKCDHDDALPVCPKNFFLFLDDVNSIFEFLYFVSLLVQFFHLDRSVYRYGL